MKEVDYLSYWKNISSFVKFDSEIHFSIQRKILSFIYRISFPERTFDSYLLRLDLKLSNKRHDHKSKIKSERKYARQIYDYEIYAPCFIKNVRILQDFRNIKNNNPKSNQISLVHFITILGKLLIKCN